VLFSLKFSNPLNVNVPVFPDPEGTQIFKELLQNADDAKASELVLLLDKRQ
jgi:hypothetical protein